MEELSFKVINFSTNHTNHFVVFNIWEYYFFKNHQSVNPHVMLAKPPRSVSFLLYYVEHWLFVGPKLGKGTFFQFF